MPDLPEEVSKAWDERKGPIVLATVDEDGTPNVIYAGAVKKVAEDTLAVVDNYFDKTRRNILNESRGAILFITKDGKAFQVKGRIEYRRSGPMYDDMKGWASDKHPRHAVAALRVEEVYQGAKKLV